jgi:hypothetical protein
MVHLQVGINITHRVDCVIAIVVLNLPMVKSLMAMEVFGRRAVLQTGDQQFTHARWPHQSLAELRFTTGVGIATPEKHGEITVLAPCRKSR